MKPSLSEEGYELCPGLLDARALTELAALFAALAPARPGLRVPVATASKLAGVRRVQAAVASVLGAGARPVRVLLFDKRDGGNWSLGWHLDRVVEVRERREVDGFGPWTLKHGRPHVAPPIALLARMMTARLHLDAVDARNGPLIVAPGSHRLGIVAETAIAGAVADLGEARCLAAAGDVWLYATPILHASDRSAPGRSRRVVQIDFSADALPGGLEWPDAA